MSLDTTIARLSRTRPFDSFPRDALQLVAFSSPERKLAKGEALFEQGDAAGEAYFLLSGAIELTAGGETSKAGYVAKPGSLIGESAMIAEVARPARAVAIEDSRMLIVSRAIFHRVLDEFPAVAVRIRRKRAARVRKFVGELDALRARAIG